MGAIVKKEKKNIAKSYKEDEVVESNNHSRREWTRHKKEDINHYSVLIQ